jgi:NAD(P)-dependent dehydrogenase (short-subunit alcohol dehydrogenase family)
MTRNVALVTGCSSGIGRATAVAFDVAGWRVWATARDPADVEALAARGCRTAALDVTDAGAVTAVVEEVVETDGRIDCLVNNAGYGQAGVVEDVPHDRVLAQFDVNVFGCLRLIRAVLPRMREQGSGTIVNVSSVLGRVAYPTRGIYAGSKHAIEGVTDALRVEVAGLGIDAVVVEPGAVRTAFDERLFETEAAIDRSPAYARAYDRIGRAQRLASRFGSSPDDVARVVVRAATADRPRARYVVGFDARLVLWSRYLPTRLTDWLARWLTT